MKISVIVPTLNEAKYIAACVHSIINQAQAAEVIVVDAGSSDGTAAIARPLATVITSAPGRAIQMNVGARQASGEVLLFLHGDTLLHPEALIQEAQMCRSS